MPGLIGKKIGMTSIFDADGKNYPCTVLEVGPCVVTQIKTQDVDGYNAVQIGFGDVKRPIKAAAGHAEKAKTNAKSKYVEFRDMETTGVALGDVLPVSLFAEGEFVSVAGTSKGKGFQGVVKRHGFSGVGESTHGQHNRARHPGSIGACSFPSRVFKGLRMAGRTGGKRVKGVNLEIVRVIPEQNVVLLRGSIPGYNGSTVIIER